MISDTGRFGNRALVEAALLQECFKGSRLNPDYGLTWWLKRPVGEGIIQSIPLLRRGWGAVGNASWLPPDMVAACGAGNQRLYVIPSLKMVIVRHAPLASARIGAGGYGRLQGRRPATADFSEQSENELGGGKFSDLQFLSKLLAD
jgi:hypothetical protein